MARYQDEIWTKIEKCKYECDLCVPEIKERSKEFDLEQKRKQERSFFKKVHEFLIDTSISLPIPKSAKHWNIYIVNHSDLLNLCIKSYLESYNKQVEHKSWYLGPNYYSEFAHKTRLNLCDEHYEAIRKSKKRLGYYCGTCGYEYHENYNVRFGLNLITGLSQIEKCIGCKESAFIIPNMIRFTTINYSQYCTGCHDVTHYDLNSFGEAKPKYIVKHCSSCGSAELQNIEYIDAIMAQKEYIKYEHHLDRLIKHTGTTSNPSECAFYHNSPNDKYRFCPICGKPI
jgi:hypothetical protein